jgi:hypothetical protein
MSLVALEGTYVRRHLHQGWDATNADRTINSEQAAIIREAAARLLAGETLYSVTSDLNRRQIPSPRGRTGGWKSANLRSTITRATLAGWREWRPGTNGAKGGSGLGAFLAKGTWPAILGRDDVERLRALLFDPARLTARRPAVNLLTGILRCGLCGLGRDRADQRAPEPVAASLRAQYSLSSSWSTIVERSRLIVTSAASSARRSGRP